MTDDRKPNNTDTIGRAKADTLTSARRSADDALVGFLAAVSLVGVIALLAARLRPGRHAGPTAK